MTEVTDMPADAMGVGTPAQAPPTGRTGAVRRAVGPPARPVPRLRGHPARDRDRPAPPDGTTRTYRRTAWTFNDALGHTVAEGSHDRGMMRPFVVMPAHVLKFDHGGAHGDHGEGHTG